MENSLKPMDKIILEEIIAYINIHQYPPTVREIGNAVGLKSPSSVHRHLKKMIKIGVIESDDFGVPRSIRVPGYRFMKEVKENEENIGNVSSVRRDIVDA